MARIFYSVSGEGRGHAARAAALVDNFRHQHDVTLLAPAQAYDFLARRYDGRSSGVRVYPIPGLRFQYRHGRLALLRSISKGVRFWSQLSGAVDQLCQRMHVKRPDLIITDFEPLLPRAAERSNVPYVSLDHQHFLTAYDLSALPLGLRIWAELMKIAVLSHYSRQESTIVTSFFQLPLRSGHEHTISVGPIVRDAIQEAAPVRGDYLVSYLRPQTSERVIRELQTAPCQVRVYGLGQRDPRQNLQFCPFDGRRFVDDLAGSLAVVGAAGNQTLGEAIYLGKPVLALPEDNHFEQRINGFYLEENRYGQTVPISKFHRRHLTKFIESVDDFLPCLKTVLTNGNRAAISAIERHLLRPASVPAGLVA